MNDLIACPPDYASPTTTIPVAATAADLSFAAATDITLDGRTRIATRQTFGTYSLSTWKIKAQSPVADDLARRVVAVLGDLEGRQQRLGGEFEAAIFDNISELYEG